MYLMINGNKHTVSRRIVKPDEIRYLSVTPAPEEVSGVIQMYDEGFKVEIPREAAEEEAIEGEVVEDEVADGEGIEGENTEGEVIEGESAGNETTEEGLSEEEPAEEELPEEDTPEPEPEPEYADFLISEDDADSFERWTYSGTLLILTNVPEPVPTPVPEPTEASTSDMARAIMEGVNEV